VLRHSAWSAGNLGLVVCVATLLVTSVTRAQNLDVEDGITFEDRFAAGMLAAPTFTRADVVELFSRGQLSGPEGARAAAGATIFDGDTPMGPLSRLLLAEPKGPAKVLRDLLNTPVGELLVSSAEAETEELAPQQGAAPGVTPAIPTRIAEPSSERPPPQNEITTPGSSAQTIEPLQKTLNTEQQDVPRPIASPPVESPPKQSEAVDQVPAPEQPEKGVSSPQSIGQQDVPHPIASPPVESPPKQSEAVGQVPAPEQPEKPGVRPMKAEPGRGAKKGGGWAGVRGPSQPELVNLRETSRTSGYIATGRALWYEHPGRTASGELFNPNQLTLRITHSLCGCVYAS